MYMDASKRPLEEKLTWMLKAYIARFHFKPTIIYVKEGTVPKEISIENLSVRHLKSMPPGHFVLTVDENDFLSDKSPVFDIVE